MAGLLAGMTALLAACTSSGPTDQPSSGPIAGTSSSSTSSAAASASYRELLLSTDDIPLPGLTLKATTDGGATAQGAAAEFSDGTGDTAVTDVVSVFGNTDDAGIALAAAVGVAPGQLDDPQSRKLDDGGTAFTGTDSGASVTLVVYTVGRAFVTLRFQSDPADPIGTEVIDKVIAAQTAKIRQGLS